jgi:tRNA G18 (ribose-2'-O)-methylase SpoU
MQRKLYLIVDNIRSAHNVGALLRVADGIGISEVILCGITPYPSGLPNDERLPYLSDKINRRIAKTSLGAELTQLWRYEADTNSVINYFKHQGVSVVALEQSPSAIQLHNYTNPDDLALVVGNEITGIESYTLKICSEIVSIPMKGQKESFNVSTAAAMALYYLTYGIV